MPDPFPADIELDGLEPTVKAYALVGRFFFVWSLVEEAIGRAIGAALGLGVLETEIVSANLEVVKKLYLLRTAVDHTPMEEEKQRHHDDVLKRIGKMSEVRNIIAHNFFCMNDDNTGLTFMRTEAKSKLKFARTTYSISQFHEFDQAMLEQLIELEELIKEIHENRELFKLMNEGGLLNTSTPSISEATET